MSYIKFYIFYFFFEKSCEGKLTFYLGKWPLKWGRKKICEGKKNL